MENSRIQLWQCRVPLVPYINIKEEPKESIDFIEPMDDENSVQDIQKLQVQDNERIMNEIMISEIQVPKCQDYANIMNEIVIPKNQIPQGKYKDNILNETEISEIQKPHSQYNENILNEFTIPEIQNPLGQGNENTVSETSMSENQTAQCQYNENVLNEIATLAIQIPQGKVNGYNENEIVIPEYQKAQGQNKKVIMNEIGIPENHISLGQYSKNIVNEIVTPENQMPQDQYNNFMNKAPFPENYMPQGQYNKNIVNEIATLASQIPQGKAYRNNENEIVIPEYQKAQGQNKKVIMNEIVISENQISLGQYSKNIVNEIATTENQMPQGQYNKNFMNKAPFPENYMSQGQYNKNIVNGILIPENQVNLSDIGNDKDVVKCRIKGCICTNPYENQNINLRSPRKKHLPRLTRIRRPFMNSPSPRRRHLPRLTRIKLPPLKRVKPLPLELGNTRMTSNLPQPDTTPLIISTQEIIHRIIQKNFMNLSMNSNVNPISGNHNISREVNKDIGKRILKKSVSMIKRMNPNLPSNILHTKQKVCNEIFGTVFECYKINSGTNRFQGEYRCIICGYRSKYSHHMKPHVNSHNLERNKENQKQISSFNRFENIQNYSLDKVEQRESKISPQILPKISKRIRKKNQWQKCPLCLYISNSTIALTKHINLSHKTHQKQKSYALYIKGDKMVENSLIKNHYLGNERIENKIATNKSRSKRIEVCSFCGFDTYSLPELNSHLRSHIPCEFQINNSVNNFIDDNQTLSSSESNITNERKINISESSNQVKDNRVNSSIINYSIKRNHKRLKISEFFPILDLNICNNFPGSINDQVINGNIIDTEYNNKQDSEKERVSTTTSDISKSNKYAKEESSLNDFIQFADKNDSQDSVDVEEDRTSDFFDTEIESESSKHDQPLNEHFRNPNDYPPKENSRKSMLIDTITESSQNELLDLSIESNNRIVGYSPLQSTLNKNREKMNNFESKNNIREKSHFSGTNYVKEDLSCLECSACFKNHWDYKRHIKRSHKKCIECSPKQECAYRISKEYPVIMKTKSFECSECNYASTTKGSFVRHIQTHAIEKQFECNVCGYRCTGSGELQRHIWVHKGGGKHLNFWPLTSYL